MNPEMNLSSNQAEGAGSLMRQAREARGMHISFLANTLRVPVERLKALEEDRWDALPDLVFARALAQSVCRQLKIEPGPVLSAMPDPDPMRSVRVTAATSQPLGGLASGSVLSQKRGLVIALVVLVVLAWISVSFHLFDDDRPSTSVQPPELPQTQNEIVPAEESTAPTAGGAPTTAAPPAAATPVPSTASSPASAPVAAVPHAPAAPAPATPAEPATKP
jgi:cytoskeleton protein RodZ